MKKKYFSLRLIAWVMKFFAWMSMALVFMEVFFLAITMNEVGELANNAISKDEIALFKLVSFININLGAKALVVLVSGLVSFIVLSSIAERIRVYIDLEMNTRAINQSLTKIIGLLEDKFEVKAREVEENDTIIDKIQEWIFLVPLLILIYFFFNIINAISTLTDSGSNVKSQPLELADSTSNIFDRVLIKDQVWSTENMNFITFRNGDTIPEAKNITEWQNACNQEMPAWCYYNFNSDSGNIYGKLYNWYAVNDPRGLAPDGWHIPNITEWQILINNLGGLKIAGKSMKSRTMWPEKDQATNNNSGLMCLPGGYVNYDGFMDIGNTGYFWSSSGCQKNDDEDVLSSYGILLKGNQIRADYPEAEHNLGLSVRCIKDN